MARHPVGDAQRPAQEGTVGFLDDEQSAGAQRRLRGQPGAGVRVGGGQSAQPQGQPDGGAAAADVVVEVAVELLEAVVQVRDERDEQEYGV